MGITSAGMQDAEYNGSLSRITSTVAPDGTNPQAKAKVLTRLEVATR
ncbi:MAG: hypothetical protein E6009_05350 [Citrobacter freundii]|nr:hypothetical protein [Citrobacter freundii]